MSAAALPDRGDATAVLAELSRRRERDADWRGGRTFSLVYHPDEPDLEQLQEKVALEYLHENALNPFAFPSLTEMDAELVAWGSGLVHGPGHGRLTSGGTESIFLAVQTARDHVAARGVTQPVLVTAETAHPAFAKAAKYLAVEHHRVPVGQDGRAQPDAMADAMDAMAGRVALAVGSAPCYPYGVIDPIPQLAAAAAERGVLFHTDACLGGWLLPFWEELGVRVPPWDFRVDGVTSLSADVHKYGWAIKGASLILYREEALLRRQFFLYDSWPGGLYGSATTAGTRPAAPIAVAWATVAYLGREGYLRLAERVRQATEVFRAGIESIPGLGLTHEPDMSVMEIGATAEGIDIGAVGDHMDSRGWHLDRQQGGLHLMLWPYHLRVADAFISDLRDAAGTTAPSSNRKASYGGIA
ncbi:MAG TPA: aminotransferase class V-fold PLP-dependent enzyme [Acidimicrobiales bacterium]|nr:aminotransferase class V-fold PLP-dependent enzyme [Acidimicrobiales bacterium]